MSSLFPRRFLPSTTLLAAFEAAARHGGFTPAAHELNLTQSAVSRQIRALEDLLGSELFVREKQKVRLTLAGEAYARDVRDALKRLSSATLGLRANPKGGSLDLALVPTFGSRWLAPRLPDFLSGNPDMFVNLLTRPLSGDFERDGIDAAISFGTDDWPGLESMPLMPETVLPLCSPAVLGSFRFGEPADILAAPLLHLVSRPDAWERWFADMKAPVGKLHGMLLDDFGVAAEAAIAGIGVALLPEFLFEPEIRRGQLVVAFDGRQKSRERYHLVWPIGRGAYSPLLVFRDWIAKAAENKQVGTKLAHLAQAPSAVRATSPTN